MTTSVHENSGFVYALCLFAALLVPLTQRFIEAHGNSDGEDPDILLFSSPGLVKKMSLGYSDLASDFYWMRTIQYYGRFEEASRRKIPYKNLYALLDITTTLNPNHLDAYRAGCFFLAAEAPLGADQPEEALKFLDKGLRDHPDEWRLLYDKGFVYYWHMNDFKSAGETWQRAVAIPGAPEWFPALAAMAMTRGGEFEIAIALWQDRYVNATRESERNTAKNRLLSFNVAQDIGGWQMLADRYREKNGAYPENLQILAAEHGLRYSLSDPLGTPYRYDPQTGAVTLDDNTEVQYLSIPDIYVDKLVESAPLTNILP